MSYELYECNWQGLHNEHERWEYRNDDSLPPGWVTNEHGMEFCSPACREKLRAFVATPRPLPTW